MPSRTTDQTRKLKKQQTRTKTISTHKASTKHTTKSSQANTVLINDGDFKIELKNDMYYIYRNNKYKFLVYPMIINKPDITTFIDKSAPQLNKILFPELANTSPYQSNDIKFIASEKRISNISHTNNLKATEMESCKSDYFADNECVDITIEIKKNQVYYFVNSLLLAAKVDNIAHILPGKYYILIIEDYINRSNPGDSIIIRGGLYDMAQFHKLDICDKLNEYLTENYINQDVFKYYVKQVNSYKFSALSAMTIFKTGFSFYEKMGYMFIPSDNDEKKIKPITPYIEVFNLFLDGLLGRFQIILMPIPEFIAQQKKNKSDKIIDEFNYSLRLVKMVLTALKPGEKFELKILHDLYKLIDTNRYSFDYFMKPSITNNSLGGSKTMRGKSEKLNNRRVLYYSIMRTEIMYILSLIIRTQIPNFGSNCHKFFRLESTVQNIFTLAQHRALPGVHQIYLGQIHHATRTPKPLTRGKLYDEISKKMNVIIEHLQKLKQ